VGKEQEAMSLKQQIQERICHAKERQQYWKEEKDIAKIWAGIECELTLVLRDLDEAAKEVNQIMCEDYWTSNFALNKVRLKILAVLDGKEKPKP
jgi:hypothetical protein